jgi:hypothetical protein
LAFANHVDGLITGDRTPSTPERPNMFAGILPAA